MTQQNSTTPAVKPVDEKALKPIIFVAIILVAVSLVMLFPPFCEVYQPTRKVTNILGTTYEGWHLSSNSLVSVMVGIPVMIGYIITLIKWCRGVQPDKIYADRKAVMSKKINKFVLLKIACVYSVAMTLILYMGVSSSVSPYVEHGAYCNFTFFGVVGIIVNIALFAVLVYLSGASKSLYIHSLVNATKTAEQGSAGDAIENAAVGAAATFAYAAANNTVKNNESASTPNPAETPEQQPVINSEKQTEQQQTEVDFSNMSATETKTVGSVAPAFVSKIIPGATAVIGKATDVVGSVADKTVEVFKANKWLKIAAPIAAGVLILITIIISLLGSGDTFTPKKTDEELIRERIDTFLTAYNDGDMEEVLNCLDAKTKNTFNALLNVMGGIAGGLTGFSFDLRDLFSLGVAIKDGDFMTLNVSDITVSGSTAVATTSMSMPGGASIIYFKMIYENDGWYISDMTDKKPASSGGSTETVTGGKGTVPNTDHIDQSFLSSTVTSQGLEFKLNSTSDGYELIDRGDCTDTHVVIPEYPSEYNHLPVTSVDLASISSATYITIPASVKSITYSYWGDMSKSIKAINFKGTFEQWFDIDCTDSILSGGALLYINGVPIKGELVIPSSIDNIDHYAFYKYNYITDVKVGASTIGEFAFACCENLNTVQIKSGTKSVGAKAFFDNNNLTDVSAADTVETIENCAFSSCENLANISLGENLKYVDHTAFSASAYSQSAENWEQGVLYIDGYLFAIKDDVINLTIKDGIAGVANYACQNHPHLASIVMPASLKYIGNTAFYSCDNVSVVKYDGTAQEFGNLQIGENNTAITENIVINTKSGLPINIELFEYNGHHYSVFGPKHSIVSDKADNWKDAKEYCESLGGHLAIIDSEEESKVLWNYTASKDFGYRDIYFGLYYSETEGKWFWVNGEEAAFVDWSSSDPRDLNDTWNYAYFDYQTGTEYKGWDSFNGEMWLGWGVRLGYICEWDN